MECGTEQMMRDENSRSFCSVVLGTELMLGKSSTTEKYSQVDLELTL